METYWASSQEEKEKIVDRMISNYGHESRLINLQSRINIPGITAGTLVDTINVELSNENPKVYFVSHHGQPMEESNMNAWYLATVFHDIAHLSWGKQPSVEAEAIVRAFTSPINVPTAYTYMSYEDLLKEYKGLKLENEYFRKQLSAINTPQRLQKYSVCFGFLALLSLALTKFFNVDLVHPILAYFVFGISAFFYLLGILMEKQVGK